jgi:hypothetical protein
MRIPPGSGLLLVGSGLYWVLAGPLIGWFSVLNPFQIQLSQLGLTIILVTGISCLVLGLWIIPNDFASLYELFSRSDGWIFAVPIVLAIVDTFLTLIGLAKGNWELNPYVASAVQIGPWAVVPFVASYIALSEGLALWMLALGKSLFTSSKALSSLPFALVCGAASFGPMSNLILLAYPALNNLSYALGATVTIGLSLGIYRHFRKVLPLSNARFLSPAT